MAGTLLNRLASLRSLGGVFTVGKLLAEALQIILGSWERGLQLYIHREWKVHRIFRKKVLANYNIHLFTAIFWVGVSLQRLNFKQGVSEG